MNFHIWATGIKPWWSGGWWGWGSIAIGDSVWGGTPNRVLYLDPAGNLNINADFVYEEWVIALQQFTTATNSYTVKTSLGSGVLLWWIPADWLADIIEDWDDACFNGVVDPTPFGGAGLLTFNWYNNFVNGAQSSLISSSDGSLFGQSWPSMAFQVSDWATYQNYISLTPNWMQIGYTDSATFNAALQITNTRIDFQMPIVWTNTTGFQVLDLFGTQRLELTDDWFLIINDWAYQLPNADGNAWDVLTTDWFGNVTFQPWAAGPSWYTGVTTNPDITLLPWDVALRNMQAFWYQVDWEIKRYWNSGVELEFPWAANLNSWQSNVYVRTLDSFWTINFYEWTPQFTAWLVNMDVPSYPSDEVFLAELCLYNTGWTFQVWSSSISNIAYQIRTASVDGQDQQKNSWTNQENDYVWLERFEPISIGGTYYAGKFDENWKVRCIQDRIYSTEAATSNGGNNDIFNNKLQAVREFENFFMVLNYDGNDLLYFVYEYTRDNDLGNNVAQRSSGSVITTTTLEGLDFCVTDEWEWVISYNEAAWVTNVVPFRVNSWGNLTLNVWWTITTAAVAPYARVSKINTGKFAFMYRENNAGRDLQVETYTTDWLTITSDLTTQTAFNDPSPISDLQLIGLDDSDAAVIYNQNNGNMYVIDATGASIVIGGANNPFGTRINVSFVWNDDNLVAVWKWGVTQIGYDVLGVNIGTQTITSSTGPATLFNTAYTLNDSVIACNIQTTNGSGFGSDIAIMYNGNDNEYSIAVAGINTTTEQLDLLFTGEVMVTNNDTDSVIPLGMARIFEDDVRWHTFGGLFADNNWNNKVVWYNQQNALNQWSTITDYFIRAIDWNTRDVLVDVASIVVPSSPSWNSPYEWKNMYKCYRKWAFIHNISWPTQPPKIYVAGEDGLWFTTTLDESNIVLGQVVSKESATIQVIDRYVSPDRIVNIGNVDYTVQNDIEDVFAERRVADMSEALGTDVSILELHQEIIARKDNVVVVKQWEGNSQLSWPTMLRISPNTTVNQLYPLVDDGDYIELSFTPFGEWKVEWYRQLWSAQYLINAVINTWEINGEWRAWVKNVWLRLATPNTIDTFINLPEWHKGKLYAINSNLSIVTTDEAGSSTGTFVTASDGTTSQDGLIVLQADTSEHIEFEIRDGKCYILNVDTIPKDKQFSFTAHKWSGSTTTASIGDAEWQEFSIGDYVTFQTELPEDVEVGRDINLYIDRAIDEAYATNNGEVQWQIEWALVPTDWSEAIDAPTHSGTLVTGDINIPNTAKWLTETASLAIASSNISEWDLLVAKVSRIAIDDGTDPTADPVAFTMHMEYQKKAF